MFSDSAAWPEATARPPLGAAGYNNMYADCRTSLAEPPRVDFAAHARALGCAVFPADAASFPAQYAAARSAAAEGKVAVVTVRTHPASWTEAGAWWEVGVPQHSHRAEMVQTRAELDEAKSHQVRYLHQP